MKDPKTIATAVTSTEAERIAWERTGLFAKTVTEKADHFIVHLPGSTELVVVKSPGFLSNNKHTDLFYDEENIELAPAVEAPTLAASIQTVRKILFDVSPFERAAILNEVFKRPASFGGQLVEAGFIAFDPVIMKPNSNTTLARHVLVPAVVDRLIFFHSTTDGIVSANLLVGNRLFSNMSTGTCDIRGFALLHFTPEPICPGILCQIQLDYLHGKDDLQISAALLGRQLPDANSYNELCETHPRGQF